MLAFNGIINLRQYYYSIRVKISTQRNDIKSLRYVLYTKMKTNKNNQIK